MKIVVDPDSGETYEVLPTDLAGGEPYDYADYRRANMAASREHRQAIRDADAAGVAMAKADREYRKQLALTIPRMKEEHGATLAEAMAKAEEPVAEALEAKYAAEAVERGAMERIRLCRDDRSSLLTMGAWSRAANADGWRDA